jgi:O-antigen biosynthesis protein
MKRLHEGGQIDTPEYYEKIWSVETNLRPFYDAVRMRALASKIQNANTVIDIGAGVYGTVQYVIEHIDNLKIFPVCYDQSYTARDIVTQKFPQILYFLGSLPQTYLPSDSFDVVVAGEIIEHMEQPELLVQELARICRPGGWISLSTVDTTCENAIKHGPYPEHIWSFLDEDLIQMFEPYGQVEFLMCGDYQVIHCRKYT